MAERPAGGPQRLRLFFALWPQGAVAARLQALVRSAHAAWGGRPMGPDILHLTLAFLGDTAPERLPALQDIGARLARLPGFVLRLDKLACWRHNHIAWVGAETVPAPLQALVDALRSELGAAGFPLETRPFAAHVTLLRDARCGAPAPPAEPFDWPVTEVVLVRSVLERSGARYQAIGRWPLA